MHTAKLTTCLTATILVMGSFGCSEEPIEPTPQPELTVSPDTVELTEASPTAGLFLASGGAGGAAWRISAKPQWVTIVPDAGTLGGDIIELAVTADFSTLEDASTIGSIQVISDIGAGGVGVAATMPFEPQLEVSTVTLDVPGNAAEVSLVVRNVGIAPLHWNAESLDAWLTADPGSGTLPRRGDEAEVTISVDRAPLPVGTVDGTLTIVSNASGSGTDILLSVDVPPDPSVQTSSSQLKYPGGVNERTLIVSNSGKGSLEWSITAKPEWASLSPDGGTIDAGGSETLTVTVDRMLIGAPSATDVIILASNASDPSPSVSIIVSDGLGPELGLTVVDHRIIDAEYNLATDRIVTVSGDPAMLHAIDADFGNVESVSLPAPPTAVSVQPDGGYAAVGHNAFVTIVDLSTMSVVQTYPVTTDVIDVVLPGNGWVYAFPRTDQWETIRSIELATGEETLTGTIRAGTIVRLHPSGDYIYRANNGLSPSDIEKYDIRDGVAIVMYDSPYHGDFAFSGDLWIAQDGERIFARSANAFRSSTNQDDDLRFAGALAGASPVLWVVTSTELGRVYALSQSTPTSLMIYDHAFLGSQGSMPLESLDSPGGPVDAQGRFAFVHSSGARVFVIVQADGAGGLALDWGLIVFDAEDLP